MSALWASNSGWPPSSKSGRHAHFFDTFSTGAVVLLSVVPSQKTQTYPVGPPDLPNLPQINQQLVQAHVSCNMVGIKREVGEFLKFKAKTKS